MNQFFQKMPFYYPPNNYTIFEEYFFNRYNETKIETEREYIPVLWTSYYINRNYGQGDISDLQRYLDSLDREKKYFTIVQYDDNILNDLKDLDIIIFAQGGWGKYKSKSYCIPLSCKSNLSDKKNKDVFASFVGCIRGRHIIREKMFSVLSNDSKYVISETLGYEAFVDIMEKSKFSLCPRGYGLTSFRIHESLKAGSIPVYLYDDEFLPFSDELDFSEIGVKINIHDIDNINKILCDLSEEKIIDMRAKGQYYLQKYFEYEGCFSSIIKKINSI